MFRKNPKLEVFINSRLYIKAQRKALSRQRFIESGFARKKTFDTDIFVTSRNGDRKIMQPMRIASEPPLRIRN